MSEQAIKAFEHLQDKGLLTADQDYASFLSGFKSGRDTQLAEADALRDENRRLRQTMQRLVTTHCAAALKSHATDAELEQYLSAGIAQLESERAALEAENARLVERTGYLVEFVQQMARQQGEPYYQKLAKATLKKWSGL